MELYDFPVRCFFEKTAHLKNAGSRAAGSGIDPLDLVATPLDLISNNTSAVSFGTVWGRQFVITVCTVRVRLGSVRATLLSHLPT